MEHQSHSEFMSGLRMIRKALRQAERDGKIEHTHDEPLTKEWLYEVYEAKTHIDVTVNNETVANINEIRFGVPCGDVIAGEYLWRAQFVRSIFID